MPLRRSSRRKTGPPAKLTYDEHGAAETRPKTPKKTTKKKAASKKSSKKRSKSPAPKKKSPAKKSTRTTKTTSTSSSSSKKSGGDNKLVLIAVAILIAYFVLQRCDCLDDLVKAFKNAIPGVSATDFTPPSTLSSVLETVTDTMASTIEEVKGHLH